MRNLTNYFCVLSPFNLAGFRLTRNNSLLIYLICYRATLCAEFYCLTSVNDGILSISRKNAEFLHFIAKIFAHIIFL